MTKFALESALLLPIPDIDRILDIRYLRVVIKLARFKNQATEQLENHLPFNMGDDPSCRLEGFWRGQMTTLGESMLFIL